ncbi:hypothetical protein JCM8547_006720 [Rhodosporidiobolus lusitaniae]
MTTIYPEPSTSTAPATSNAPRLDGEADSAQLPSSGPKDQATQTEIKEERRGKNVVLLFPTNVLKLSEIVGFDHNRQVVYYQTGIGTAMPILPHNTILQYILKWFFVNPLRKAGHKLGHMLDAAFAVNLGAHVQKGYRFVMEHYEPGDKIYLFGFSRGAYTARALACMLDEVGLLPRGNQGLIPLAYKLSTKLQLVRTVLEGELDPLLQASLAGRMSQKQRFYLGVRICALLNFLGPESRCSRIPLAREVAVHFVGVWQSQDTVSSVGGLFQRTLPFTASQTFIKMFRQALALDERRVDYLPELAHRRTTNDPHATNVKEVWFAGCHADVGGAESIPSSWLLPTCKQSQDEPPRLSHLPLSWLVDEAVQQGLLLNPERLSRAPFLKLQAHAASVSLRTDPCSFKVGGKGMKRWFTVSLWKFRSWVFPKINYGINAFPPFENLQGIRTLPHRALFHSSVKTRMLARNIKGEPDGKCIPLARSSNGQRITLENVDDLIEWVN